MQINLSNKDIIFYQYWTWFTESFLNLFSNGNPILPENKFKIFKDFISLSFPKKKVEWIMNLSYDDIKKMKKTNKILTDLYGGKLRNKLNIPPNK